MMRKPQTIEDQAYVLYPHKGLLLDELSRSRLLLGLLMLFAVFGATVLFVRFESLPAVITKHHPARWALLGATLTAAVAATAIGIQVFAFRRVRYVFSPLGIRIEGGIKFHSDLITWIQINDINVSATITEQVFGCGTLVVGTYKFGPQFIRFVSDYKNLRAYLEAQLQRNLKNARTINAI